ncbi:MAG: protein RIC-3 [Cressdnaviricota sp.]|nr:MAG: protein RIC-3 [Cressdnaviricota sp.]
MSCLRIEYFNSFVIISVMACFMSFKYLCISLRANSVMAIITFIFLYIGLILLFKYFFFFHSNCGIKLKIKNIHLFNSTLECT